MVIYDQKAYVEVDPRVQLVFDSTMPLMWDQTDLRGKCARGDEFLDDAARYGTQSGIVFTLHDVGHGGIMMVYNSQNSHVDAARVR